MPDDYETNFTISRPPGLTGPAHLENLTRQTLQLLEESATGHPGPEVESGQTGDTAYAIISATRRHQGRPEHSVQLEVGICTACQSLAMQVSTRFISPRETGPPQIPAGPPHLLSAITASNRCCADTAELTSVARILDAEKAADFAASQIFNGRRTLPILLISPHRNDEYQQYADSLQQRLLGLAQVICLPSRQSSDVLSDHTGYNLRCYNETARLLYPGIGHNDINSAYYPQKTVAAPDFIYRVQQDTLPFRRANNHDLAISDARVTVVTEKNRQLESAAAVLPQPAAEAETESTEAKAQLRREQMRDNEATRKYHAALSTIQKREQELAAALRRAAEAEQQLQEMPAEAEPLAQNEQLLKENRKLTQQIQQAEKAASRESRQEQTALPMHDTSPHTVRNVTLLNHAINLCRNPLRNYIVRRLRAAHGQDLTQIPSRSVEFYDERTRQRAKEEPAAAFDVSDFVHIVEANLEQFEQDREFVAGLRNLRFVRNRAAHPDPSGVSNEFTLDNLRRIADTMDRAQRDGRSVRALTSLLEL